MDHAAINLPLRDIHLPDSISWWPLAPAWWITFGVVLLLICIALIFIKRCLRPSLKRQAIKTLDIIEKAFQETENGAQCLSELSVFLRRVVISQNPLQNCAGLTGNAWLQFLDQPLGKPEFSQGIGQILLNGPYQFQVEREDAFQLIQLCRKWVNCL